VNPSSLTLLVLQLGFLLLLWVFVFIIVYALRSDLFGQRVRKLQADQPAPARAPRAAAPAQTPPAAAPRAAPAPPSLPGPPSAAGEKATLSTASRLVITTGPRAGTELQLGTEPLTIGRSGESGLVIRDDYTSTHHARLLLWNNEWMIQDLDSTNGTFLAGKRVTVPTQIPLNTPIRIGSTEFELRR
jgi:pSer/pThr/pTyr-binding forkhead associated (FHA) protein